MDSLLSIENLSIDFVTGSEKTHALKKISFHVNHGEIVSLVGESGSGKSVSALSVLRLLPSPPAIYTSGKINFATKAVKPVDLLKISQKELQYFRGNKIGIIFQEPMTSLNPVLTCGQQVAEAIQIHKKSSYREAKKETITWFEKVKLPDPVSVFSRYPHQLSGGQKQRVMIAMAMSCKPDLLICDEPTTALDVTVQKTILELIKELQEQTGMGVIFITHDLGVVAEIANRAIVMYKGEIVEQGTVYDIFSKPQHPYTKALLACRPVNHKKGKRLPVVSDFITPEDKTPTKSSFAQPLTVPSVIKSIDEKLLQVKDLSVWFPVKKSLMGKAKDFTKAVDQVSFDVLKGETLGIVGESGCGKTTLGRTLLRLINPTSGSIHYKGENITLKKNKDILPLRKEMQIVFQDPYSSLNPRITIGSAIAEPMRVHHIAGTDKERKEKVIGLLEKVNLLPEHFNRYPHEFSGGQRQRIVIARALSLHPSFIVCDESVSALDVSVQAQVLNLLNDLKKEFGFTIIFISHDLSVVNYLSDRILVMNKGKIEEIGTADEIMLQPASQYTRKLINSIPKGIVA
ncbi:MAG TPA: ABC transporter ATP-binding protein [Chitinophagaceae bacterium]|nr:ABC transporter ATP-binding protein [Chitinophagaceae bacterium]